MDDVDLSPESPATSLPDASGDEERAGLSSPCLDLDELSSSDEDTGTSLGLSDLAVTLLCDSDEVFSPVNSDQVPSDVDFPPEPVSCDKRQVVRRRAASPDVVLVDAPPGRRAANPRRSMAKVASGKRMPWEVSMTVSPVPPALDMTVTCTSGVVPMSTQPPGVTSVPAKCMATVTSRKVDVPPGPAIGEPVRRTGPAVTLMRERMPPVASSTVTDCPPPSSSLPLSGQSATHSSEMIAWGDAGDSSVPLSPNRVQEGRSQDVPEEGSLFHVSLVSPGFLTRPSRDAPQFPLEGVLLPTTINDFSDSDLGAPMAYAQCELFPGSDAPMSLPVFSVPSGFSARPDQSSVQTVLALGTSSHPDGGSSAVAPPMDMEDSSLLETGLPGCLLRYTLYSGLPFADGNPAFGLQLHHPRFLEFVGAPGSARLLLRSPAFWVDQLGKEQAMAAAVNLQRDAGIMLSNLQILSQFAFVLRIFWHQFDMSTMLYSPDITIICVRQQFQATDSHRSVFSA